MLIFLLECHLKKNKFDWLNLITSYYELYNMSPWWLITLYPHTDKFEILKEQQKEGMKELERKAQIAQKEAISRSSKK